MASVSKRAWTHKGVTKEAWVVRYVDRGGKHRSRQFERKKPAEDYRRQVENEMEAGTHVARGDSRTVLAIANEYIAGIERRRADGEVSESYVRIAKLSAAYFLPAIGNVLVADLTWQMVERLVLDLRQTKSAMYKRPLAKKTIATIYQMLRATLDFAVRRGYVSKNAARIAATEIGSLKAPPIERFSRAEITSLLTVLERKKCLTSFRTRAMMRCLVYLALFCGLRRGEILALRWEDIDLDAREIRVRHSLNPADEMGPTKTVAGIRDVPMPSFLADALAKWRPFAVEDERHLIFRTRGGGNFEDGKFYRRLWHPLLSLAGIAPTDRGWRHFHALRHFAGSAWLDAGIPLPDVSRMLGHANPAITAEVYSYATQDASFRAPAMQACAAALLPPPPLQIAQGLRNAL